MNMKDFDRVRSLIDERQDLFTLRTGALTNPVTMAAGTTPFIVPNETAVVLIDTLIETNATALRLLGVKDVISWRMPATPPMRETP